MHPLIHVEIHICLCIHMPLLSDPQQSSPDSDMLSCATIYNHVSRSLDLAIVPHRCGLRYLFTWLFHSSLKRSQELPFWGHFAVVAIAQYHTVLVLVLLSKSLSYVLGICEDAGYVEPRYPLVAYS